MNRIRTAGLLVIVAGAAFFVADTVSKPERDDSRPRAQGANVFLSNCPFDDDWTPTEETRCDFYAVYWVRHFDDPTREDEQFHAFVEHTADLVQPDGSAESLLAEFGLAETTGTFDDRLQSARLDAVDVSMTPADAENGPTPDLAGNTVRLGTFTWTATSQIYRWGNDGPYAEGAREESNGCRELARQTLRVADATGTVEGQPIDTFHQLVQIPDLEPAAGTAYIFDNEFNIRSIDGC